MRPETLKWIRENWETWECICRVGGKSFTGSQVIQAFTLLLALAKENPDFDVIFTVFITIYEYDLPFFSRCTRPQ